MKVLLMSIVITSNLFVATIGSAQEIIMEENIISDTIRPSSGPNMSNYSHTFLGLAFAMIPDSIGSEINYGKTFSISFGYRYKAKINNVFALGIDFQYQLNSYSIKQISSKLIPNDSLHDKEKLKFHNMSLGTYFRINYGKRGNHIGNFVDFGMKLDLPFLVSYTTKNKLKDSNENGGKNIKTRTTSLDYIEPFTYSAYARIGFNRYVITGSYRLSNQFSAGTDKFIQKNNGLKKYPEFPALTLGLEIGLH